MSTLYSQSVNLRTLDTLYVGMRILARDGYTYFLTEPVGTNYSPDFNPVFTPIEMLNMGVFEGKYLNDDCQEYPVEFFKDAKISVAKPNEKLNYFGIKSRLSTSEWVKAGWIKDQDPKGWFQWYCRYYMGRRTEDDSRQIKRWKAMARHAGQIKKNCPGDLTKRLKQRQTLLQWSWDPFI